MIKPFFRRLWCLLGFHDDKRGSTCLLVEDFCGIGPRLELVDDTRNLQVDIRQWVYHCETRRQWP